MLDNEPIIRKNSRYSKKRNSSKDKYFICHDKGHFVGAYHKSNKAKRETQLLAKIIDPQHQVKDKGPKGYHSSTNNIYEFVLNADDETPKNITSLFIDGQP